MTDAPNLVLTYRCKSVYGQTLYYPTGAKAAAVQRLTGRKTLTDSDVQALKELGFVFTEERSSEGISI